jgi:hypothetical protein
MASDPTVYIVHCIDTEGPLFESLEATFERLRKIFGITLPPSKETLAKLQSGKMNLNGLEAEVARVISPQLLNYNDTWDKIDAMLNRIGSESFRKEFPDSEGNGWVYNWHCVDHVGYLINPRRKDIGFHNIFDHYQAFISQTQAPDKVHWHFHPTHPSLSSHETATFYLRDTKFFDCLSRRLIDRNWFPSVNRAGFHVERPDSHWLLEQWIPFDFSNQACSEPGEQPDLAGGRFGDWRRAPKEWTTYQPAHDDYQVEGNCRRYIGRCLNVGTRHRLLDEAEVRKAFAYARQHGVALMAFTDHDFRDIGEDVAVVRDLLKKVSPDYPEVRFRYMEAREAINRAIFGIYEPPSANILKAEISPKDDGQRHVLSVRASEPIFGPQPFLAVRTKSGTYYHDNFDFQEPFRKWTYVFDECTFAITSIEAIAVGTNDRKGFPHIVQLRP